jgi:hypothetical protein
LLVCCNYSFELEEKQTIKIKQRFQFTNVEILHEFEKKNEVLQSKLTNFFFGWINHEKQTKSNNQAKATIKKQIYRSSFIKKENKRKQKSL